MTADMVPVLQGEGAEFFSARLKEFEPKLTPVQKSLYLSIIGLLRAQHAASLPVLRRYSYVKETIAILEQAKQLSGGRWNSPFYGIEGQPDVYQPYYILREHVIDRLHDQNVGYWGAHLEGLDHPSRADRAGLLVDYLGLSEAQIVKAADRLAADGKYEMAADLIEAAEPKFSGSGSLKRAKRFAYLKLMEKNQNTDPFKFIIYSGRIGEQTPQINRGK